MCETVFATFRVLRVLQVQKCHSALLYREDHCARALAVPLLLSVSAGVLTRPLGIHHPLDTTTPAAPCKAGLVPCASRRGVALYRHSYKRREILAVVIRVVLYLIGVKHHLGLVISHTSLLADFLLKYKNGFLYLILGLSSSDTRTNYNDLPPRSRHLNRLFKMPDVLVYIMHLDIGLLISIF